MKMSIEEMYDYIAKVTATQKRLLLPNELYGDGSLFNNDKDIFLILYTRIWLMLPDGKKPGLEKL